jgi:CheY-like chemotaxis protein
VIDDEAVLRALLSDMIAACGYEVDVAEDGSTGIARFRERQYDVVVTDLLMPGLNGLQVAAELRTIEPQVQVILLTGSAPALSADRARESGVVLLHKPIALKDLKTAVDAAAGVR